MRGTSEEYARKALVACGVTITSQPLGPVSRRPERMLLRRLPCLLRRPRSPLLPPAARAASAAAAATAAPPSVAIVGSGPSGFYAAKYLLKEDPLVRVDVLDILPSPFGASERAAGRGRAGVRARVR